MLKALKKFLIKKVVKFKLSKVSDNDIRNWFSQMAESVVTNRNNLESFIDDFISNDFKIEFNHTELIEVKEELTEEKETKKEELDMNNILSPLYQQASAVIRGYNEKQKIGRKF